VKYLALKPLEMGDRVATMTAVVWLLLPMQFFCFKLTIIDGIGGGKEVDNNNNMPEEAIKCSSCLGGH
jgi:hypothetical protein